MLGYRHYADDCVEYLVQRSIANGIDIIRIFDALNDIKNLKTAIKAANKEGGRKAQIERLCKFKDTDEAAEAYGYGDITAEEYQEVCDALEKGAAFVEFTKTPKAAALEILKDFMVRQKHEIVDLEWSMKSPKEQERIRKENEEYRITHRLN